MRGKRLFIFLLWEINWKLHTNHTNKTKHIAKTPVKLKSTFFLIIRPITFRMTDPSAWCDGAAPIHYKATFSCNSTVITVSFTLNDPDPP